MRRYNEPIAVVQDKEKAPCFLIWRKQRFQVMRVNESWRWAGKWWLSGRAQRRFYFRVEVQPDSRSKVLYGSRTFEIYRCGERWTLWSVGD